MGELVDMLTKTIRRFRGDQRGATAIEYGLLAALVAVAIIGTFSVLGNSVQGLFNNGAADTVASQTAKMN